LGADNETGGRDYYKYQQNENVMTIYDYQTDHGSVRAFYQVLNTTCWGTYGQYYETFMGDIGTLLISERAGDTNNGWIFLEDYAKADDDVVKRWNKCIRMKLVGGEYELPPLLKEKNILVLGGSMVIASHPLLCKLNQPVHQPHLKNFFDAIRSRAELTCPGRVAYETAVAVLKANEAMREDKKIDFSDEQFQA